MDFGSLWDKLVGTPVPSMLVIVGLALVALGLLGKLKDWFQLENILESHSLGDWHCHARGWNLLSTSP